MMYQLFLQSAMINWLTEHLALHEAQELQLQLQSKLR